MDTAKIVNKRPDAKLIIFVLYPISSSKEKTISKPVAIIAKTSPIAGDTKKLSVLE